MADWSKSESKADKAEVATGQGGLVGGQQGSNGPAAGWHGRRDDCEVGQRRAGPDTRRAATEKQPLPSATPMMGLIDSVVDSPIGVSGLR